MDLIFRNNNYTAVRIGFFLPPKVVIIQHVNTVFYKRLR